MTSSTSCCRPALGPEQPCCTQPPAVLRHAARARSGAQTRCVHVHVSTCAHLWSLSGNFPHDGPGVVGKPQRRAAVRTRARGSAAAAPSVLAAALKGGCSAPRLILLAVFEKEDRGRFVHISRPTDSFVCGAGAGRRARDGQPGPHGVVQERDHHHDVQPGQRGHPGGRRLQPGGRQGDCHAAGAPLRSRAPARACVRPAPVCGAAVATHVCSYLCACLSVPILRVQQGSPSAPHLAPVTCAWPWAGVLVLNMSGGRRCAPTSGRSLSTAWTTSWCSRRCARTRSSTSCASRCLPLAAWSAPAAGPPPCTPEAFSSAPHVWRCPACLMLPAAWRQPLSVKAAPGRRPPALP